MSIGKRWSFLSKFEQNHYEKGVPVDHVLSIYHPVDSTVLVSLSLSMQMYHGHVQYLATSETTALLACFGSEIERLRGRGSAA